MEVISTSKPIRDVAEAHGVGAQTLRHWLITYRQAHGGTETEVTVTERARWREPAPEKQELRAQTAFQKRSQRLLREGAAVVSKDESIDSQRPDPDETNPATRLCAWLGGVDLVFLSLAGAPAVSHGSSP